MTNAEVKAIIAEKLFGWELLQNSVDPERVIGHPQKGVPFTALPNYRTSPDKIFGPGGVVEKMRERGWFLLYENESACFHEARDLMHMRASGKFHRPTITEAVCFAAAAALEAKP